MGRGGGGKRAKSSGRKTGPGGAGGMPTPEQLDSTIAEMVNSTIDKYMAGGKRFVDPNRPMSEVPNDMVPIHEIRDQVRAKFGDEAASPAVFDRAVRRSFQENKIDMQQASDGRIVNHARTKDAIPDHKYGYEHPFYWLGKVHVDDFSH